MKRKTLGAAALSDLYQQEKDAMTKTPTPDHIVLADEIEAAARAAQSPPEGTAAAPGGLITILLALAAAVRAQDFGAVLVSVRDLLDYIIGEQPTPSHAIGGLSIGTILSWIAWALGMFKG